MMNENKNLQRAEGALRHSKLDQLYYWMSGKKWHNTFHKILAWRSFELVFPKEREKQNVEQVSSIDWFLWRVGATLDYVLTSWR